MFFSTAQIRIFTLISMVAAHAVGAEKAAPVDLVVPQYEVPAARTAAAQSAGNPGAGLSTTGKFAALELRITDGPQSLPVSGMFNNPGGGSLIYTAASSEATVATVSITESILTITPVAAGATDITITARDDAADLEVAQTFRVTAISLISPGTSIPDQQLTASGEPRTLDLSDYSGPQGNPLSFTASSNDLTAATVGVDGNILTITPLAPGTATITITVRNNPFDAGVTLNFQVQVINVPPTSDGIPDQQLVFASPARLLDLNDYFSDTEGDELSYSDAVSSNQAVATLFKGDPTNFLLITPTPNGILGTTDISVTANDRFGGTLTQVFQVETTNQAPISCCAFTTSTETVAGGPDTIDLDDFFSDPDASSIPDHALSYTAVSDNKTVATVSISESILTITPVKRGAADITVTASDGLENASLTVRAFVNPSAPTTTGIPNQRLSLSGAGGSLTLNLNDYFSDPDGDSLEYEFLAEPQGTRRATEVNLRDNLLFVSKSRSIRTTGIDEIRVTARKVVNGKTFTNRASFFAVVDPQPPRLKPGMNIGGRFSRISAHSPQTFNLDDYFEASVPLSYRPSSADSSKVRVRIDGSSLTVTPVRSGGGSTRITILVSHGLGSSLFYTFDVSVPNNTPTASGRNTVFRFTDTGQIAFADHGLYFTDLDDDPLSYTTRSNNTNIISVSISPATGNTLLRAKGVGIGSIRITARDPLGASVTRDFVVLVIGTAPSVTATILGPNQRYLLQRIGNSTDPDNQVRLDLNDYFSDADGGQPIYTVAQDTSFFVNSSLSGNILTITPTDRPGDTTFTVTATDRIISSLKATQTFAVAVVNSNPVRNDTPFEPEVTLSLGAQTLNLDNYFSDPDADSISYALESIESDYATVRTDRIGRADNLIITPLKRGGPVSFTITASDPFGGTSTHEFEAEVGNAAPVRMGGVPALVMNQGDGPQKLVNIDSKFFDHDGDDLTYTATPSGAGGDSVATVDVDGDILTITPLARGRVDFDIAASDGHRTSGGGLILSRPHTLSVNVKAAPTIAGTPALTVDEDSPYSFMPSGEDADGDTLVYAITNMPSWASFDTATGALTGTPVNADVGDYEDIVISVTDGSIATPVALPAFDIAVTNTNDAPTISGTPATSVAEDSAYSFTPTGEDVDVGDTLVYAITNMPPWASFSTATGALTGTPANEHVGDYENIVISVTDGIIAPVELPAFDIAVTNTNDAPTISGTPATSVAEDSAYSFTPSGEDADGDPLEYAITNMPSWASFDTTTGALTGTPANEHVGDYEGIVISVTDGIIATPVALPAFAIAVTNTNDAPTISGTPATTVAEDSAYSFTPSAEDADGDPLTFAITNMPSWASFSTATGALTGTPANEHVGDYENIVISVTDGIIAPVELPAFDIAVTNTNDAPTISGTPATSVAEDSAYSFTPSAEDADGDPLTFAITNMPSWASFSTATGALTGTPANADVGDYDDIVISVTDGIIATPVALPAFDIAVTNTNDAPTLSGTPATSVAEDSAYSFTPSGADDDGDRLEYAITNMPSWASFSTTTGALTGTPANADVGNYEDIVISVTDGIATPVALPAFDIAVTNTNDAPTLSGTPATSVAEDSAYSFTPSGADDDDDTLEYAITNMPSWATFDTTTGALTGTPANADVGNHEDIVISVTDGIIATPVALPAFDIEVTNTNDAPTLSGTPATSVAEDSAYSFTPTGEDDDGDRLTFAITNLPSWASFSTTTGALTGTPANADVGNHEDIVISVTDGIIATPVALPAFDIEVTNTNDAPTLSGTPATSVAEDSAYSFTPTGEDDDGDRLTFAITNLPSWASFSTTTGALTGTPVNADVGDYEDIVISVTDGIIATPVALAAFDIAVTNTNDAPTLSGTPATSVAEDSAYSFTPTGEDDDGDRLTFAITNLPSWASFSTATGALTGTPANADVGNHEDIVISVTDGIIATPVALPAFDIAVTNTNDAPTISGTPDTSVAEDSAYSFTPTGADDDGDTLTFAITNLPSWASFSTTTGALTGTPANADVGNYEGIVISVTDGIITTPVALPAFDIAVTNTNDAPTISGTPATSVAEDSAYSFTPTGEDDDGDRLTFAITNLPSWASFSTTTGALTGTPVNADVGDYEDIVISVTDGIIATPVALAAFDIAVTNTNDAPTLSGTPATSVAEDSAYSFTPSGEDDDGDRLTFAITNLPSWANFSTTTGALTGTPANADVGDYEGIVISVTDGIITTPVALAAFAIAVTNTNDAPTLSGTPATSVAEDSAYSFTPSGEDDDGDRLTFAITNLPSWANFSTTTGALTGTPANADVGDYEGIVISVTDGIITTPVALAAFAIAVTNTNDAPTLSGTPATSVAEDSAYSFTPTGADDDGDTLVYAITNMPSWASFSTTTGALTGTPANADVGTTTDIVITVRDRDTGGLSASLPAFSIEVTNTNDAPTLSGTPATSVAEDSAYSFTPSGEDVDVGNTLTFAITNLPSWASFDTATGALTGTPVNADVGDYEDIVISVTDGIIATPVALPAFDIAVTNTNDAPTLSGTPATSVAEDSAYSFTPSGEDDDGDRLTFAITNLPSWASFSTTTGALTGTPANEHVGDYEDIVISVTDGIIATPVALPAFAIEVTNTNDAPTISGTPATTVAEDSAYNFTPTGEDADGDTLTWAISNKPDWANFSTTTGALTGTPDNDDVGDYAGIVISVTDGIITTPVALPAFAIAVTNTNDAPTLTGTPAPTVAEDSLYSFTPSAEDADGDPLTWAITNIPSWASFSTATGALTGTPANADVGTTTDIVISVTDGIITTPVALAAFDIAVTNTNDAPTLSGTPDTSVAEDSAYSFTPSGADDDGDTLVYAITNLPSWASFDTATGALTGTPVNADVGDYEDIVISVTDGIIATPVALPAFDIAVTNTNDAPTLSGTPATSVAEDSAYSFTPSAEDADGDPLTFAITNMPSWASFDIATGALTGTPDNDDVGDYDGIVISVTDGIIATPVALAPFDIAVTNTNDAPTLSGTPATSVAEDSAYSFTPSAEDADGDPLTFAITNMPSWASFDIATGALTGTPDNDDVGDYDGIVISVTDGIIATPVALAPFDIAVTNTNDAPTLSGTPATSVAEDSAYNFTPTGDDDDGDTLTFAITNMPSWASFSTTTGALTGTPANEHVGDYADIVISVTDGIIATPVALAPFDIAVTNTNDAPTLSGTPVTSVAEDSAYNFTPSGEDADGDTLTWAITNMPPWASFDTTTGALTGTPVNADVGDYADIVISVTDGIIATPVALPAFAIAVTNTNDAPTLSGTPDTSVAEDSAYSFTPSAEDADGDPLTFAITNMPSWASFSTATGALTGTPANADVGDYEDIVISVTDGIIATPVALPVFDIAVTNTNDAPTLSGTPATSVAEDSAYSFMPTGEDADGDTLTWAISNKPDWANFSTTTGALTGTPANADVGNHEGIVISVTDGIIATPVALPAFDIAVTNTNDAPTISGTPATSVAEDSAYSFTPSGEDDDGDTLTWAISNIPSWASFDIATGALTGTPDNDDVGDYAGIVISVTDGIIATPVALPDFDIAVTNTNDPPTISGTPATSVAEDSAYSFTPSGEDADGDPLTFAITNMPSWASFDTATGALAGTPTNEHVGNHAGIVISVTDGIIATPVALPAFAIAVTNTNDAPTLSGTPATSVAEDSAYSFTPSAEDADGDRLTFAITNLPSWATFDETSGALTGTPVNADVGDYEDIVISVTDGIIATPVALPAFDIAVTNTNDAPTLSGTPATSVAEDSAYSFTPTGEDADGDPLTWAITNMPSWASFDTTTGALTGTPTNEHVGAYADIVISVTDGIITTPVALPVFAIVVTNTNDAPTLSGTPATSVAEDSAYSFTPSGADDDGDTLTWAISNKPDWANFSTTTGALTGTPANEHVGNYEDIVISVTDGIIATPVELPAFAIAVTNTNDAPTISGTPATSVAEDSAYSFTPSGEDADGDPLTWAITNMPSWASFNTATGALTGTPANADVGNYEDIVISVTDGIIATPVELPDFDIAVTNTNDAPTLSGTPATSVAEDSAYSFTPNGEDADGDPLTFAITNMPSWASFDTATGALAGTPTNEHVGNHAGIVISVTDGIIATPVALPAFDITVTNTNDAPTISGTPATTVAEDSAYNFTPSAEDADGDTLEYAITNMPSWASFSTTTGALTGTPTNEHVGDHENIVISVTDGIIATPVALPAFAIAVTNTNDAPTLSGTPATSVAEDSVYSFTPTGEDADGDPLTWAITNIPSWASFDTATGALTGTPTNADVGNHEGIVISVTDGIIATPVELPAFDIAVTNTNDAPTISGTPATSVAEDSAYSFTPTGADDDDGATLTFAITNIPSWAAFSTATGALTGTPANADVGDYENIVISVTDGIAAPVELPAFDIAVTNTNDAPTLSGTPATTVAEDSAYSFTPTGADDDGDPLTWAITNMPSWASFDIATGALTGTPANEHVGNHADIVISVTDGIIATPVELPAFAIEVTNTNDAPTLSGTPATSVAEDSAYNFTPTGEDADGDTLTFAITNMPSWASFDTATGALTGTPVNADVGDYEDIVISVTDGIIAAPVALAAFDIAVTNTNDAPTISGTPATSVAEDSAYNFTPSGEDDDGDRLTWAITNMPSWASFDTATGALTGTPANADVGDYEGIVISVTDGIIATPVELPAFDIAVTNTNDAPTLSGTPATSVAEDSAYSFTPTGADDDGDTLTFAITNMPSWASFSTTTGALTGTPANADVGDYEDIVISVTDGIIATPVELAAFDIAVTNTNDPPTLSGTPATTVAEDSAYSFTPTGADDDGDTLEYTITNMPSWASFSTTTGALTGTPANEHVGDYEDIVISVTDGIIATPVALPAFDIAVTNTNDAPTLSGTPATSVAEDNAYSFTPTGTDDDGDTLTFAITNMPSWASFSTATGALTGTPANADVGDYEGIVISVTDGIIATPVALLAFDIAVTNTNDAPTLSGTPAISVAEDSAYSFTPTGADDDGDTLTWVITNMPSWATFSTTTGALTGTPSNEHVGDYANIVISVTDGIIATPVALPAFAIAVTNTNDAPTLSGTPDTTVAEDSAYSFMPSGEDADGDRLTFAITNMPSWASFSTTTGALTGTPVNADVGAHADIVISVTDGIIATPVALAAFDIAVTNTNDAPTLSGTPATSVAEDSAYSFTPTGEDADGDTLTWAISNKPDWANFSTTTGALTGTPANADVGNHEGIVISVTDGIIATPVALPAFDIAVTNTNDAPTISGTPATSVAEDSAYSFTPSGEDDDGDTLTWAISNIPSWASFDIATGALTGTPDNDDVGDYAGIVISVTDGIIATPVALPDFDIAVTNTNDPPTISGTPATSVAEDSAYSFTPSGEDDDGDTLTFAITNLPSWAAFSTAIGSLTGTPANADVGNHEDIVISVTDGIIATPVELPVFAIEVTNTNDAPTLSGTPATSVAEDSAYSFTPSGADADGDSLTWAITNQPPWASFSTATGALTGTPTNADVGDYAGIVISVTDGIIATPVALAAFDIAVTNTNDAPTISGTPAISVAEDSAYSFTPSGEDADGDRLTFAITNMPAWASFSTTTGALTGTPVNADVGDYEDIVISVTDGIIATPVALAAFDIEVTNTNDAPTLSGTPATTVAQGAVYSFTPTGADDDGDRLTWAISNMPDWANFSTATGALTGTPVNADVGDHEGIVISVTDGIIATPVELPAFDIAVTNTNDAPIADAGADQTVAEGASVILDGSGNDPDGDNGALTYAWTQVGTPMVSLSGENTATPSFTAPSDLSANAALEFMLTVTDPGDASGTDLVEISVTTDVAARQQALKIGLAAFARSLASSATDAIGQRLRPVSTGPETSSFNGFSLSDCIASITGLTPADTAGADSTAWGEQNDIGSAEPDNDSRKPVGAYRLPDFDQFARSAFVIPLNRLNGNADAGAGGGLWSFWGRGDLSRFEGRPQTGLDPDGGLTLVDIAGADSSAWFDPNDLGGDIGSAEPDNDSRNNSRNPLGACRLPDSGQLARSAFVIPLNRLNGNADADANSGYWSLWGRGDLSRFEGRPQSSFDLDGDLTAGYLGLDYRLPSGGLVGVALSRSEGEIDYRSGTVDGALVNGTLDASLDSVYPYGYWSPRAGLGLWGLLGVGSGDATLTHRETDFATDLDMRMGALGLRQAVQTLGSFELALRADAFIIELESEDAPGLPAVSAQVHRARLLLEASHRWQPHPYERLGTSLELGERVDGGDADEGAGAELGVGLEYSNTRLGLRAQWRARRLLAHSVSGFEEWGTSLNVEFDPGVSGQGLALTLAPTWGQAASGGAQALWQSDRPLRAGLVQASAMRMDLNLSYGLNRDRRQLSPFASLGLADGVMQRLRLGLRLGLADELEMELFGGRNASENRSPEHLLGLTGRLRF